jgi:hypothetical protein
MPSLGFEERPCVQVTDVPDGWMPSLASDRVGAGRVARFVG